MAQHADIATEVQNELLLALPAEEMEVLLPLLEPVDLPYGLVVKDVNVPSKHVYFPDSAIISSVSVMADGSAVETATIGKEGMSPIARFLGVDTTPEHIFIQVPGWGHRMRATDFDRLAGELPTLTARLRRYTAALLTLMGQSSGCNRKHGMVQRCARWILVTHDMVGRDRFEMTHLVLSQMLGVRRASVTEAALHLQQRGALDYSRGVITVKNRAALEAEACECYGVIRSTYDRLLRGRAGVDPLASVSLDDGGMSKAGDGAPSEPADVTP